MYHGFLFNSEGTVVEIPGQAQIPPKAKIKSYKIIAKHSWLWIWMGDPDKADETLIPEAIGIDDPDWLLGHGNLDYQAEARLINENLLDFSHLTYVHANSFGADNSFADNPPNIKLLERGIRFERWNVNSSGGNSSKAANEASENPSEDELMFDSWSSYDFIIPGVLLMRSGNYPVGTAEACNFETPNFDEAIGNVTFTSQAVTPTKLNESRYFFSWGPHKKHGDEKLRDLLMDMAGMAFEEDRVMIEGQQKVINVTADPAVLPSVHDRGVNMFNRLVAKLAVES